MQELAMAALAAETAQPIPPATGIGLRRPADEVEFFGNFSRFLGFPAIHQFPNFSIPRLPRCASEEFRLTPFGSQQTYRMGSPYLNAGVDRLSSIFLINFQAGIHHDKNLRNQ